MRRCANLIARDARRNGVSATKSRADRDDQRLVAGRSSTAGASYTASILALLLVLVGTVAVTHLLENLRNRRDQRGRAGDVDPSGSVGGNVAPIGDGAVER